MLGHEPDQISALHFLHYCRSGGGLLQMRSDGKGGGQALRIRQGTQSFSTCLAADLPANTVQLSSPVTSITQLGRGNAYVEAGGQLYTTKQIISAVPLPVLKTITFDPPLPLDKQILIDSFRYGFYRKVMAVFKEPFWVRKGYCGLVQSFKGPASVIRDTSSPADNKHVLTCFMAGAPGAEWAAKPQAEADALLLKQIANVYQSPEAEQLFVEFVGSRWGEEEAQWSGGGCPSPSVAPGVLDSVGHAIRETFGVVHFAGTETAEVWKGYMEGAATSGIRAAREVDEALMTVSARL